MLSLKNGSLKKIVGDYSEFINLVPTSFNKVMDIFLTHVSYINNIPVLYKYTCIELKTEKAMEKDLTQLLHYEDWLARKLSSGDHEMIQSILVANQFSQNVIDYVLNRKSIENRVIRLLVYKMDTDNRTILLNEIL